MAYNGVVYAGSLDHKLYALDAKSGDKIAEFDLGSPVASSPVLVDSSIIVASEEGNVYSLDTRTNQIKPLANVDEKVYAPLSAADGVVYIYSGEQNLHALNTESGVKLWSLPLSSK